MICHSSPYIYFCVHHEWKTKSWKSEVQQKAAIEFLTREGEKLKKIHECLKMVYGENLFDVRWFVIGYVRKKIKKKTKQKKNVKITGPDHLDHLKLQSAEIYAEINKKICNNQLITERELLWCWSSQHQQVRKKSGVQTTVH